MTDFISDLENELRAASTRRVRLATARLPRPPVAGVALILSSVVCVLVVLAVLQGHARTPNRSTSGSAVSAQLTSNFAVFRRPRTQADAVPRGLRFECSGPNDPKQYLCFVDQQHDPSSVRRLPSLLQLDQSRRLTLPDGVGTAWLIPTHNLLCVLLRFPSQLFFRPFPGTMTCQSVQSVLARPPMHIASFLFNRNRGGYELAVEPDRIASARITYPGGSLPTILNQGFLVGCAGQGDYKLTQTTSAGTTLKSIAVGGYGRTRSVSCPRLHQSATVAPASGGKAGRPTTTPGSRPVQSAVIKDCLAHGRLARSYTNRQLRRALAQMSAAVRKYTNCVSVIRRGEHK